MSVLCSRFLGEWLYIACKMHKFNFKLFASDNGSVKVICTFYGLTHLTKSNTRVF